MSTSELRGIWTYRSFLNAPDPIGNFDKLQVWEAELYIDFFGECRIHGSLGERPAKATGKDPYLTIAGEASFGEPTEVRWRATGRPGTEYAGWIYDYVGYLAPAWRDGKRQRLAIVGTVTRTVARDQAPAGSVFSFVAVKRDFGEPRQVIALAEPALKMLAAAEHRHHHALWHGSRDERDGLSAGKKEALRSLGWQPGPNGKSARAFLPTD